MNELLYIAIFFWIIGLLLFFYFHITSKLNKIMQQIQMNFGQNNIPKNKEINYASRKQNSKENQKILDDNLPKFNYQCRLVLNLLNEGKKLTVGEAAVGVYDKWEKNKRVRIGDLRARIRDIRKYHNVQDEKFDGGFKIYFIK